MTTSDPAVPDAWLDVNRANWEDRTRIHSTSRYYDLPGFRGGACTLRPFELAEVGEVTGLRLLHLQCHMGQDTLSWARLGAEVTGLDFSETAVGTARALAQETGLADRARFVLSDVYQAPAALAGERFDLVYTGFGSLVWLPDLSRWARVVADLLADGGALYLAELHPLTEVLDEDGRTVRHDYFENSAGTFDCDTTYTDGPTLTSTVSVQWTHQLGSVVTALAEAGLRIDYLHEHDVTVFQRYTVLEQTSPTEYRFPAGHPRTPLAYSLRATKPA